MKKPLKSILVMMIGISLILPSTVKAWEGVCGYEGGISTGIFTGKTSQEYQEICFVTGEPVIFKGNLDIRKSVKDDTVTATYKYTLKNIDRKAVLSRVLIFTTKRTEKPNGQIIEETSFSKIPSETIKIDSSTYVLKNYDFTRTNIVDKHPSVHYYAGNTWGKKTYQTTDTKKATVTVEATGRFYGYDEFWGSVQTQLFDYVLQSEAGTGEEMDQWGGTASIVLSNTSTKNIEYMENEPEQISFEGGYLETQYHHSVLEYTAKLPEFDKEGVALDNITSSNGSLMMESFPVQKRLPVSDLRHLKGHWAENDIRALFSLEVLKEDAASFNPEQYTTRAQFTAAITEAAKEVPIDPAFLKKTTTTSNKKTEEKRSPFKDVSTSSRYFDAIFNAYQRGIIYGVGSDYFRPDGNLILADALSIFIRALGLESMAPSPTAVTSFRDNDDIPVYARNAVYVAEKIGLIQGDTRGYLKPMEKLTKARTAVLINRFIQYMRNGIAEDYRDGIINFQ